jgi:DNA-binding MarR family transcriptional regulator
MSRAEQFETSYRKLWAALHRPDDPDLSQHEREILHHVPAEGGCTLSEIVTHLGLPKSSCSEIVKGLTHRGFLNRVRDPSDDRRLQLTLTARGKNKVADDRVLNVDRLAAALGRLGPADQKELVRLIAELAESSTSLERSRRTDASRFGGRRPRTASRSRHSRARSDETRRR